MTISFVMVNRLRVRITIRQEQPETGCGAKGHDHDQISDSLGKCHEILQRVKSAFHNISSLKYEFRLKTEGWRRTSVSKFSALPDFDKSLPTIYLNR